MARKKSVVEVIPPGAPDPKPAKMKTVAAKHTITYEAPVDVPVVKEEEDPDDPSLDDGDPEEIEEHPRYRPPSFRMKLKQKFQQRGIGGDETLTLRIDRLPNFEMNGLAGVKADKEFCGIITCTEKFFDHDEYLIEIQRRYGPGEYWLTVRHKNSIMNSWRERIGGYPAPAPATSETGQSNPQGFQPMPNQPVGTIDPLAQLRSAFKMVREFKADLGLDAPQPAPAIVSDPKIAALQLIAENPDVMEKIGTGIAKTVLGSKGSDDSDPWAEVAKEAIRSGQASEIVASLIREIMAPFRNMWGQNNGQAQMGAQTVSPVANQENAGPQESGQALLPNAEGQRHGAVQEMVGDVQGSEAQGIVRPEEHALAHLIDNCRRGVPVRVAFDQLLNYADALNDQAPQYSIDGYISIFAQMTPEQAIEFVKTQPGGEQVASLPHAKEWTAELQRLIKEAGQEGEE